MAQNDNERIEARLEAVNQDLRRWLMQLDTRIETLRTAHSLLWDEMKRLSEAFEKLKERCGI